MTKNKKSQDKNIPKPLYNSINNSKPQSKNNSKSFTPPKSLIEEHEKPEKNKNK